MDLTLFSGTARTKNSRGNNPDPNGFKHEKLFSLNVTFKTKDLRIPLCWFPVLFWRLKRLKPEVIISEGLTNLINNICTWLYCRLFSVNWILWDSGRNKQKPMSLLRRAVEPLNIFMLKSAKAILAYSGVAGEYFNSLGISSEKIFIANNTIDIDACFKDRQRVEADPSLIKAMRSKLNINAKKVILYVGALEKGKRVEDLIKVFENIKMRIPDLSLLIIGDGSHKARIHRLIRSRNITDCLVLGKIIKGLGVYFSIADIFVLPGRGGLAVNQAMAYGKPVVVREADGTEKDLVKQGDNGFIVKNNEEFEAKITQLLKNQAQIESMGKAGLKIIKNYDLDNVVRIFLKAIEYVGSK
ncbi:MAG: glycosyltransferase family 4 protein [Spirochaetales bacterium]|nr:glycosyltransferase family 4 protein [Spirochaetales bacterium]